MILLKDNYRSYLLLTNFFVITVNLVNCEILFDGSNKLYNTTKFECSLKPLYSWQCDSGQCIQMEKLCDGIANCADKSDETVENCLHKPCPEYAFKCAYGGCITGAYKCNGILDCVDGSDETRFLCNSSLNYWQEIKGSCWLSADMQCKSGDCISSEKACDGVRDCSDGSDETVELCSFRNCPEYAFRCGYGACIAGSAKCNGVIDCLDASDESPGFCGSMPTLQNTTGTASPAYVYTLPHKTASRPPTPATSTRSPTPATRVSTRPMIAYTERATTTTTATPFPVFDGSNKFYNGILDCVDGSDETRFLCDSSLNYWQEIKGSCWLSADMQCKSGDCISSEKTCDGVRDCSDGSDETVELCSFLNCPEYAFRCGYGACIAGSGKCNGVIDCLDASDESPGFCGSVPTLQNTTTTASPAYVYTLPHKTASRPPTPATRASTRPMIAYTERATTTTTTATLLRNTTTTASPAYVYTLPQKPAIRPPTPATRPPTRDKQPPTPATLPPTRPTIAYTMPATTRTTAIPRRTQTPTLLTPISPSNTIKYCDANIVKRGISTITTCTFNNNPVYCYHSVPVGTHMRKYPQAKDSKTLVCHADGVWTNSKYKFKCIPKCGELTEAERKSVIKPWDVTITKRSYTSPYQASCSGVIVSPNIVVTAANCLQNTDGSYDTDPFSYSIIKGSYIFTYSNGNRLTATTHNVYKISIKTLTKRNALAILVLIDFFRFTNYIRPICLPTVTRDTNSEYWKFIIAKTSGSNLDRRTTNNEYIQINNFVPFIENERKRYQHIL